MAQKELVTTYDVIAEEGLDEGDFVCPQCSKMLDNVYRNPTMLGCTYICPDCEYEGNLEEFHIQE